MGRHMGSGFLPALFEFAPMFVESVNRELKVLLVAHTEQKQCRFGNGGTRN